MELEEAKKILASAELVYGPAQVQEAVTRVAGEIHAALADRYPLILCVMTGGMMFAGQLLPILDFPHDFDYMHVTRYGPDTQGGKLSWRSAPWTSVKGRTVLVVDDILDEGITLAAVKDSLRRLGAAEVMAAVFVDKQNGLDKPVHADFVGLPVPNRFVFGFGMDVRGAWRHLPAIYAAREE